MQSQERFYMTDLWILWLDGDKDNSFLRSLILFTLPHPDERVSRVVFLLPWLLFGGLILRGQCYNRDR